MRRPRRFRATSRSLHRLRRSSATSRTESTSRRLEAVAQSGHSLLLVGPRQTTFELERINALLSLPNVQWVGPKPFESLPSYLRITTVGLTPYADSDFNRASFPLKTLEYLAAGKPVVSTDLPAARWLATDLVTIAKSPADFAHDHGTAVGRTLRTRTSSHERAHSPLNTTGRCAPPRWLDFWGSTTVVGPWPRPQRAEPAWP